MVKINVKTDCGNAPKKEFIRDFEIAYIKKDRTKILQSLDSNIEWNIVGNTKLIGREEVEKSLDKMLGDEFTEFTIENIITHGNVASANGTIHLKDGGTVEFCDVFKFTSHAKDAKLKKISSYVVLLKKY